MKMAYFVSPHGFGHAARAAAVMEALIRIDPDCRFVIFGRTPEWFFRETLGPRFTYVPLDTDVGLVQSTPLEEDLAASIQALEAYIPYAPAQVAALATRLRNLGCGLVACDISPLGLAAGQAAGLPTVLVENFTWDWIYEGYLEAESRLAPFVDLFRDAFGRCDLRFQCRPWCVPHDGALQVGPVARRTRSGRAAVRKRLGIAPDQKMVLVSMGGVPQQHPLDIAAGTPAGVVYVVIGTPVTAADEDTRYISLAARHGYHHPDLMAAADVLVGKVGYSTIAEAYQAGVPFAYVNRPQFREAACLADFVRREMPSLELDVADFYAGRWGRAVAALLDGPRPGGRFAGGADAIASAMQALARAQ